MLDTIHTSQQGVFTASTRKPRHNLKIAWNRDVNQTISFATVGTSLVGGSDIIQGEQSVLTKADFYQYIDESDNVLKIETERILEEPLGGIAYAQADFTLDNNALRFTPNVNNTVGTALLPNRPVKIYLGMEVNGTNKAVPNLYGLSGMPRENKANRTVEIHCFDYLRFIDQYSLETEMYVDQYTHEIVRDILINKLGFSTDQFVLDPGLNLIPFAWFEKGTSAGDAIRRLCEAEEAVFYQDETGMLRFENRRKSRQAPHNTSVWTINPEDVLLWEEDPSPIIINRCVVRANPRAVASSQEIWRDGIVEEVGPGETIEVWAHFEDPVTAVTNPASTTDYLGNASIDGTGADLTANLSLLVTTFATDAKIEIENTGAGTIYVTFLRLRGTPALVTSEIQEIYEDDASISKYDRHELVVENNFINNDSFAYYMARALVKKYKDPRKTLILTVPAIPTIQLRDIVTVRDADQGTTKEYRVMRIQSQMFPGQYNQTLRLREVFEGETDTWAIVGSTLVGSDDELVGI